MGVHDVTDWLVGDKLLHFSNVGEGTRLAVIGISVGVVLAAAAAKLLASLFLGLAVTDVVPFVAVAALLTASVLLASWMPARRAARVDPMTALRAD